MDENRELAAVDAEADWKIKSFERTPEDCIFTYTFRDAGVTGHI